MILTNEIIENGKSENGGYSLKQLKCFGIKRFKKGWKLRITGKDFPQEKIDRFLALRNVHVIVRRVFCEHPEPSLAGFCDDCGKWI